MSHPTHPLSPSTLDLGERGPGYDALPNLLWWADAGGRLLFVNRAWAEFTGRPREEDIGTLFTDALHEADRESTLARWRDAWASGRPWRGEFRLRCGGAGVRRMLAEIRPYPDEDGGVRAWVGSATDIHDEAAPPLPGKTNERSLSEREADLTLALGAARIGTWLLDFRTGEEHWSAQQEALYGFGPGEFGGSKAAFLGRVHPEDRPGVEAALARAMEGVGGERYEHEFRAVLPGGEVRRMRGVGRLERDACGRPLRLLGVNEDVTERRRTRALLAEQTRLLEDVARGRAAGDVLADLARTVERHGAQQGVRCTVLTVAGGVLRVAAAPSLPGVAARVDGTRVEDDLLPCARAITTRAPVLVPDVEAHDVGERWRADLGALGVRACASAPILTPGGEALGSVALLFGEAQAPTPALGDLLGTATHLAGLVLGREAREAELRESQGQLALAFEAARMGLWDLDPGGDLEWSAEPSGAGRGRDTLEAVLARVHPEDRARVLAAMEDCQRAGRFEVEFRVPRPGAPVRWLRAVGRVRGPQGGGAGRVIGVYYDVTARREAERALRGSQAQLQAVLETTGAVVYVQDLTGRYLHVNRRWRELFSGGGDVTGKTPWDVFAGGVADAFWANFRAVLDSPEPVVSEETAPHPGGEHTYVSVKFALRDEAGAPYALCGMSIDITGRKRAEEALRDVTATLEARVEERTAELADARERAEVLAGLGEALQAARSPGEVARLAVERLGPAVRATGMVMVRLLGERLELLTSWGHLPGLVQELIARREVTLPEVPTLWRVAQTREALYLEGERALPTPGEAPDFLAEAAEPILMPGGTLAGFMVAWRPAEAGAWQEGQRDLFRRAAATLGLALERAEVAQDLVRANAGLRRSNSELERFAYIASHDLQEPIRTVSSFAGLLERRYGPALDERARLYLDMLLRGSARMKTLVDDLLAFSRLSGDGVVPRPLDLGVPLAEALSRLAARLTETGARLTHDPLPGVRGDGPQLAQLFQNLIANALKFARRGVVPQIHIGAAREGEWWHLTVSDNGIGIEAAYLERIFVMFQRLHTREQYEGTGLGLAICQKIVEGHGGRIWAESTPGEGSTFHFTLHAAE